MTNILITGTAAGVAEVAAALRDRQATVLEVSDLDELPGTLRDQQLDGYVQLPVRTQPRDSSAITRVRDFLATGLLRRFDAVEAALPALAEGGAVVLVAGHHPEQASTPDDRQARMALLRVLAMAVRADRGRELRVVVLDHTATPEQIAERVLGPGDEEQPEQVDLTVQATDRYEDWRTEIIGLAYVES